MRRLPLGIVLILLIAGCAAKEPARPESTVVADDFGLADLRGLVSDEAMLPIAGANVTVVGEGVTKTDDQGRFVFEGLFGGSYELRVNATGYRLASKSVEMPGGQDIEANFQLVAIPTILAYETTAIKSGRIFCGADWRIQAGGPQGPLAACGALYATPVNDLDSFAVTFDLSSDNISRVRELVFETEWTPTQTFGGGLRVYWEAYQEITPGYQFSEDIRTFAQVQGSSPLWGSADHIDILDNVTGRRPSPAHCVPDGPCRFWGRVFPFASTLGSESPVDVSTYMDQSYTHYVTEFYGLPAPTPFSALP